MSSSILLPCKYHCSWCMCNNITVVSVNKKKNRYFDKSKLSLFEDIYPEPLELLVPDRFYPIPLPGENRLHSIIIKCNECFRYSNIKNIICKLCKKEEFKYIRIENFSDPDYIFDNDFENHFCEKCKYPFKMCNHVWIKKSCQAFLETFATELECRYCGQKKYSYSSVIAEPNNSEDYGFYE